MAYYRPSEEAITVGSTAEYAQTTRVSPEFFRVFAVEPILGRLFTAEEVKPDSGGALVPMALPGQFESMAMGPYFFDHLPPQREWPAAPSAVISVVAPGTFRALGIPLKSGRDFKDGDGADKPLVAVVNESLVLKSLPGENPIGRTVFCLFDSAQPMTIIGVAGEVRERGPARESMPECYIPFRQHAFNGPALSVVVRTAGDPIGLEGTLRRVVNKTSPTVPMKFTTMEGMLSEDVATPRFRTLLFGVFAGLAVCLTYPVAQARSEQLDSQGQNGDRHE